MVPGNFHDLWSEDRTRQGAAFLSVLELTSQPVDWAYEVWDEVLDQLRDKNNRNRSIAAQVLSSLAKSDPSQRMLRDFPALFEVVSDERFVTARHALQSLWKVGCVGEEQRRLLVAALERRFRECAAHKNCTLIRYDILECLRQVYDTVQDPEIPPRAQALIELEPDPKYQKKYRTLWR
jgi:hypothetical protein